MKHKKQTDTSIYSSSHITNRLQDIMSIIRTWTTEDTNTWDHHFTSPTRHQIYLPLRRDASPSSTFEKTWKYNQVKTISENQPVFIKNNHSWWDKPSSNHFFYRDRCSNRLNDPATDVYSRGLTLRVVRGLGSDVTCSLEIFRRDDNSAATSGWRMSINNLPTVGLLSFYCGLAFKTSRYVSTDIEEGDDPIKTEWPEPARDRMQTVKRFRFLRRVEALMVASRARSKTTGAHLHLTNHLYQLVLESKPFKAKASSIRA